MKIDFRKFKITENKYWGENDYYSRTIDITNEKNEVIISVGFKLSFDGKNITIMENFHKSGSISVSDYKKDISNIVSNYTKNFYKDYNVSISGVFLSR